MLYTANKKRESELRLMSTKRKYCERVVRWGMRGGADVADRGVVVGRGIEKIICQNCIDQLVLLI